MKSMLACLSAVVLALVSGCRCAAPAETVQLDLSSPEATVVSFTKAAALGQVKQAQACFLPGGVDYHDTRKVLTAIPGSPRYQMKQMLLSIDADAPMPIIASETTSDGTKVVWRVTFRRRFETKKGLTFEPGATYDFDAMLKQSGTKWLIDNL